MATYGSLATPHLQIKLVNAPASFSYVPPYQTTSALPSQNMIPGLFPSVSTAAVVAPAQLIPAKAAAPPGGSIHCIAPLNLQFQTSQVTVKENLLIW